MRKIFHQLRNQSVVGSICDSSIIGQDIKDMKTGKTLKPPEIIAKIIKISSVVRYRLAICIVNQVVQDGVIPMTGIIV